MSTLQTSAQRQLRQFVEQIERLEEDKKQIGNDITDKYTEAKAVGFDAKAIRQVVRLRRKSQEEREEEESILDVYLVALGMKDQEEMNLILNDEVAEGLKSAGAEVQRGN